MRSFIMHKACAEGSLISSLAGCDTVARIMITVICELWNPFCFVSQYKLMKWNLFCWCCVFLFKLLDVVVLQTSNYSFAGSCLILELDGFSFFEIISSFFTDLLLIAIKSKNMGLQGFLTVLNAGWEHQCRLWQSQIILYLNFELRLERESADQIPDH